MKRCIALMALGLAAGAASARIESAAVFAPAAGLVDPAERAHRDEVCLNGLWQFQPAAVPADFRRGGGEPPELSAPRKDAWDATPIKIPSPWNVNAWGNGRDAGAGTARPYWPDSVWYPGYPAEWDRVEMGWLRRTFRVPAGWEGRRIVLHFEAVAGECRVLVNGQPAGSHFDKYLPFELDVTALVRRDGDNELLVGVRSHRLFDRQSARYPKMRAPYPCGSETEGIAGIWQDVFLLGLPPVRVAEVFVKPRVDQDVLELEVAVRNDDGRERTVSVGGEVRPWTDRAGDTAEPRGRPEAPVLSFPEQTVTVAPGATATVLLREKPANRLKAWSPAAPNLHAAVVVLREDGRDADRRAVRFGWRQFSIRGRDLLLNGEPIRLTGDFLHPFGPFVCSRSYVRAWYRMIRDMGGNAVRPHAQPHPRHYLDLADEMGLVVLDETAIFGSSIALNFEEPAAWTRFEEHYDGLVRRDRNHPSVLGWSFGNELFAVFDHNGVPKEVEAEWYRRLAELGLRARALDPTREWISCDGDEDLRGTLPVWSKHFGHGTPLDRLPNLGKPLMVGESGGTYYARPRQMAEFNGPRAYESYAGRNEALAIDVRDNLVRMAIPRLAYYSASETAWFGVEHLNYGYRDFTRPPGRDDGVFFSRPFEEGRPGMQPERLPPFVATLNPGWDPELPPYKPLAMFEAQKAALAPGGPRPCAWDRRPPPPAPRPAAPAPSTDRVGFVGDPHAPTARRLRALGVPLSGGAAADGLTLVDAASLDAPGAASAKAALEAARAEGGAVLVMLGAGGTNDGWLPAAARLTERPATMLVPDADHPWTAPFALPDLYFAEDGAERFIQRRGIDGPILDGARVLLRGSDADWSLFNEAPERAKCAAVLLYERMAKPSGAALIERAHGKGRLLVCSLEPRAETPAAAAFWRRLFANAGVRLTEAADAVTPAFDDRQALVRALAIGRFPAESVEAALAADFIGEASARPAAGAKVKGCAWQAVESPSRDRFILSQMKQPGPETGAFAAYFSCWVRSPRALDDLLADGPDAPRFTMWLYAADRCRLFLNGRELQPARTEQADYRALLRFERVPLKRGWNHVLVKVASDRLTGDTPATLAVRIGASPEDYLRQIESAVEVRREMR